MSATDQGYYPAFLVHLNQLYTRTNNPLVVPRLYNCYLSIAHASVPITWYNVPSGSNTLVFKYQVKAENTPRTFTFTVPPGNYSATELASVCTWSGTLAGTTTSLTFTCIYQENTQTYQFMFGPNSQLSFFALTPSTLALTMGFSTPQTNQYGVSVFPTFTGTSGSSPFTDSNYKYFTLSTSDQCADLSAVRNIHVNTNYKVRQFSSGTNTLDIIPVTQGFGSIMNYNGAFSAQMYDNVIGDIVVSFTDDNGVPVNFNGVGWSLTLRFDFVNPDVNPRYDDTVDPLLAQTEDIVVT